MAYFTLAQTDSDSKPDGYTELLRNYHTSWCRIQIIIVMTSFHWWRRALVQTWIPIPNPITTLYYAEHVHIAEMWTWIPIPYFCVGQESESESVPEPISGNVNEPLLPTTGMRSVSVSGNVNEPLLLTTGMRSVSVSGNVIKPLRYEKTFI